MSLNDKAVIFDNDGVLVDTGEFHKQSWFDFAAKHGYPISDEFFRETFGMQNYQILALLTKRELTPAQVEEMADWKEQRYRDLIAGKLQLLDGVRNLLEDLRRNGFKTAIGTSAPRKNIEFMLEAIHVRHLFDAYATCEDARQSKPAPDTYLRAAEKLHLAPRYCVVVEDAVAGVQAGKNAGMKVVAVTNSRRREELFEADRIVDSLAQVSARDFIALLESKP